MYGGRLTNFDSPYLELDFPLIPEIKDWIKEENYLKIDQHFKEATSKNGEFYTFLSKFCHFTEVEFILAIRTPPDEDGIWHDDGSRKMAFSLSLNIDHLSIEGGCLYMRHRTTPSEVLEIGPRSFGKILLFKTGVENFEHKVGEVKSSFRFVVAGWCS